MALPGELLVFEILDKKSEEVIRPFHVLNVLDQTPLFWKAE